MTHHNTALFASQTTKIGNCTKLVFYKVKDVMTKNVSGPICIERQFTFPSRRTNQLFGMNT
jgi:hypothetical protein